MKKITLNPVKGLLIVSFLLVFGISSAATYTAVASGNWSSAATWGGTAPPFTLGASDQVTIGAGMNVTMDGNVTVNGVLASIDVAGTLSAMPHLVLDVVLGTITGSGTITAAQVMLTATGSFTFTGALTADTLMNAIIGLGSAAQMMVNNELTLAGLINVSAGGTLQVGSGSDITISGGTIGLTGGSLNLNANYNVNYVGSSVAAGLELSGAGLKKVTANITNANSVTLGSDLIVDTLDLISGNLVLNGHNLAVNANIDAGGAGMIQATPSSNITITTATSPSGSLMFSASGDTVNNLTVNVGGGGSLKLLSDAVINGALNFINGYVDVQSNNLSIGVTGAITGAGANSYVITRAGGYLTMHAAVGDTSTFQVGTPSNYMPAEISLNVGSATGTIGVNVSSGVYSQGVSGVLISSYEPMVNATWFFQDNIGSGALNANMKLSWEASTEVNTFTHKDDYISHYVAGWDDVGDSMNAVLSGNLYSVTRANLNSLSPFAVFDQATIPTGINQITADANNVVVYPNPVNENLFIKNNTGYTGLLDVEIYNIIGQIVSNVQLNNSTVTEIPVSQLSPGTYFIKIYNGDMEVVKKFNKVE